MTIDNHRKHERHKLENTFVVNQKGVCRVFDLSAGGVSFGCTSEREIPESLTIDIIDDSGAQLFDMPVETVWAAPNKEMNTASIYEVIVGARFRDDLTPEQQFVLDQLFESS